MVRRDQRISKREILKRARGLAKVHGEGLTLAIFRREAGVSQAMVYEMFGSWCGLRLAVGLAPMAAKGRKVVSAEGLQERLRDLVNECGEGITFAMFCRVSGYSSQVVVSRFGSWRELRESVGLSGRAAASVVFSDEEILLDMAEVYLKWKRVPGIKSYRRMGGEIAPETIRGRFGSWSEARRIFRAWRERVCEEEA